MKSLNPFVLDNTDVYSLKSEKANKQYGICIQYPEGYLQREHQAPLPVVYILDAQWHFPTICAIYGTLHHDNQMPEALIVGITWQQGNIMELREHDLTPDCDPDAKFSGGADAFLDALEFEILPHIQQNYATTDKHVLIGSSYGGVFSYYACLARPHLFTDYIAFGLGVNWVSPNTKMQKLLNTLDSSSFNSPTRLIVGRGQWEPAYEIDAFTQQLIELNIPNLQCEFITVEQAGHALVNPQGFTQSLQKIFHQPAVTLSKAQLSEFCGTYKRCDNEQRLEFYIEDEQLCTQIGFISSWEKYAKKATLTPIANNHFHILGWQKTFTFKQNEMILTLYGQPIRFIKQAKT